jgi:UDP-N-acetylmuramoyl-L-alanyl-D-glutamate--2,6-diaminopimelate ligase
MSDTTAGTALPNGQDDRPERRLGDLLGLLEARGQLRSVRAGPDAKPAALADVAATSVRGITNDSRRVGPGTVFVAVPGFHSDGHDFASAAVAAGASALIVERPVGGVDVPELVVERSQLALPVAAAWWEGWPAREIGVVGVTGTDGKSTSTFLMAAMLAAAGLPSGLIGTVEIGVGGRRWSNDDRTTTPDAPELQGLLRAMVDAGDRFAVLEATSHGLALERVGEIAFDVGVVTNVTHEHLEFHGTHEAYRAAKRSLMDRLAISPDNPEKGWGKHAVLNRDDRWFEEFDDAARTAGARIWTYGADPEADLRVTSVEEDASHLTVGVATPRWDGQVRLQLAGRFNVYNVLAAVGVGEALGLDPEAIQGGLESVTGVPGRMERIDLGQPFGVIVDYAHTPDSLEKVLDVLAPVAAAGGGGLIAVFGSAGERDTIKRPVMGRVAGERARLVVVTDEDPRLEDADEINRAIAEGAIEAGKAEGRDLLVIADREEAIATALERARPGDVVVLAGKGHESSIFYGTEKRRWDDREAARKGLRALGYG